LNERQVLSIQESILRDRDAAAKARYKAEDELQGIHHLREVALEMKKKRKKKNWNANFDESSTA
jgi:hypothetical protein